jgi:hypothetical protein
LCISAERLEEEACYPSLAVIDFVIFVKREIDVGGIVRRAVEV